MQIRDLNIGEYFEFECKKKYPVMYCYDGFHVSPRGFRHKYISSQSGRVYYTYNEYLTVYLLQ